MNPDLRGLMGKSAIVTGASRGIGLAIAAGLLDAGVGVCITARDPEALDAARESLQERGEVLAVAGSADDGEHQQEAVAATVARFGRLDLLVNNAATNPVYGPLSAVSPAAVRKILEVNVVAALCWTQAAWSAWMAVNGGAVVNVSSVGGQLAAPGLGAYNTSKAALDHLTRQLALELAPAVRVNAIAPAVVRTRFARALYEEDEPGLAETYPLARLGEPQDVADLAVFLLSEQAGWITGQVLTVDGGLTLTDAASARSEDLTRSRR